MQNSRLYCFLTQLCVSGVCSQAPCWGKNPSTTFPLTYLISDIVYLHLGGNNVNR